MAQFRKKPVVVEAVQFDEQWAWDYLLAGRDLPDGTLFRGADYHTGDHKMYSFRLDCPTLEGNMKVSFGDWIIKGVKGEYYPCKPDIFTATYETC